MTRIIYFKLQFHAFKAYYACRRFILSRCCLVFAFGFLFYILCYSSLLDRGIAMSPPSHHHPKLPGPGKKFLPRVLLRGWAASAAALSRHRCRLNRLIPDPIEDFSAVIRSVAHLERGQAWVTSAAFEMPASTYRSRHVTISFPNLKYRRFRERSNSWSIKRKRIVW